MRKLVTASIAATVLLAGWIGFAQVQEKPRQPERAAASKASAEKDADEEAIRKSADAFIKAYNAHDSAAVAKLFAKKAELTDEEGQLIKGRDAIEQNFAAMFKLQPECKVDLEVTSVRVLTPNIAIEEGIVNGQPSPDDAIVHSSYIAIHVKVDGQWQIASCSDFAADSEPLTPNDHLQELAWMTGDWVDESPDAIVKSSCYWDDSGNYLLLEFQVQIAGIASRSGSMRIGWDPLTGQLKSWTFGEDGSYAEGLWTRIDNEWIVKSHGVNADGQATSAMNVFRHIDQDTMAWRSYDRVIGGAPAADVSENVIKRHAPTPGG